MIGKTISHYTILEKLGEGGMGVVYKAQDSKLKRTVALKFLPHQLLTDERDKARFVNEAQTAAALDHPNICTVHEIDTVAEHTFIAMAYIRGSNLESRIASKPFEAGEAASVALQLCGALREAHEADVIHRDIKPANIMISDKGQAILLDFGLARLKGQAGLTREGTTVGTSAYMSPEQIRGDKIDRRTDIWSLGVVLYQMITGQLPFRAEHEAAVLYSIVNEPFQPASTVRPGVPAELDRIIENALAKDPRDRYPNVDALQADLEVFLGGVAPSLPGPSVRIGVEEIRRRRFTRTAGVIMVAVITAVVVWMWPRDRANVVDPASETTGGSGSDQMTETMTGSKTMTTVHRQNSIAVLPLDNLSGDEENAFFVDGMTEELITQLAQIKALKVISRTSVMRYRDTDQPMSEIAEELGVRTILEGSVLWAGDRVRINAQLIDGGSDEHLWADSYESDLVDVLGLQRRVAKDVAAKVKVELSAQEETRLGGTPTVDRAAYELYLKGRYHWNKRTREGIRKAMDYYRQALDRDPNYAASHAGLAESYLVLGFWAREIPSRDIYPHAREYAFEALKIDPELAAAHAVLGGVAFEYDLDWDSAESRYRRAIELSPNYATAHQWYAEFLMNTGRHDEAIREITVARELDPLSMIIRTVAAWTLTLGGEYEEALGEFEKIAEFDPGFPPLYHSLTFFYMQIGDFDKLVQSQIRFLELTARDESDRSRIRGYENAFLEGGYDGFCRLIVSDFKRKYDEEYMSPFIIAFWFGQLGEADSAMAWLELGYNQHAAGMHLIAEKWFDKQITENPRYVDLLKRMNLERGAPAN